MHNKFVPEGETVDALFKVEILKRFEGLCALSATKLFRKRRAGFFTTEMSAHSVLIVHAFLVHNSITVLEHLPYSLDFVPCDYFLFSKRKLVFWWQHFGYVMTLDM